MLSYALRGATIAFVLALIQVPSTHSAAVTQTDELIPKNECRLQFNLPDGATVSLDGKDYGAQREITYSGLASHPWRGVPLTVRFADGSEQQRNLLLSGSRRVRVAVPDPKARRPELLLQIGHRAGICSVAFSPNGRQVVTASDDDTAILWDTETGTKLRVFQGHTNGVQAVAFSPNGRQIVTGSYDKTAILWDVGTGTNLRVFEGHIGIVTSVAFSPDGRHVLAGGSVWRYSTPDPTVGRPGTAVLWDASTGVKLRTFKGHNSGITSVTFSPNGRYVLTGSTDCTAILWDAGTGSKLRRFEGHGHNQRVTSVAFSPDGRHILTGSRGGETAILWDAKTGRKIRAFAGHNGITSVEFSPNGRQVVTGSAYDTTILWDTETGTKVRVFQGHTDDVAFSPNGRQIVTGGGFRDGTAILWNAKTGTKLQAFEGLTARVSSIVLNRDGRRIVTAAEDGATLWNTSTGTRLLTFDGHMKGVTSVALSPNAGQVLTGSYDGTAILWDAAMGTKLRVFAGHSSISSVAFGPDGRHVLTGSRDGRYGTAILWEAATGTKIGTFRGSAGIVSSVALSSDGRRVLTASEGVQYREYWSHGWVKLWDVATGAGLHALPAYHGGAAFSPDGRHVLMGSENTTAILWDARTGAKLQVFQGHRKHVESVAFAPDGRQVLTGSGDGTARLWDVATADELLCIISLDGGRDWLVVTPEGLFDGSRIGCEHVHFRTWIHQEPLVVPVDRFFQEFYHPGLLAEIWQGKRPMAGKQLGRNPAPEVQILLGGQDANTVQIDFVVTDRGGGIYEPEDPQREQPCWLLHNGSRVGQMLDAEKEDGVLRGSFVVSLLKGENRIQVQSASADGSWESEPAVFTLNYDGSLPDPELYELVIGINKYHGGGDLKGCVDGAKADGENREGSAVSCVSSGHPGCWFLPGGPRRWAWLAWMRRKYLTCVHQGGGAQAASRNWFSGGNLQEGTMFCTDGRRQSGLAGNEDDEAR